MSNAKVSKALERSIYKFTDVYKTKLRQSIDYYNVYLENKNWAVHMRIEEHIKMLVNNVQNAPSFQYPRASKYQTASHTYHILLYISMCIFVCIFLY